MSDSVMKKSPWPFKRLLVGGIVLMGVGVAVWYWLAPPAGLPNINLDELEPAVRAVIVDRIHLVQKTPDSAEAWGNLGIVLTNQTFVDDAQQCFARAEILDPKDARWPYFQGEHLLHSNPTAALPKFQRAVELSKKETVGPRLKLAELYLQLGQFDEAKEQFRFLLNQYAKHPRVNLGMARVEFHAGHLQEALDHTSVALTHPLTRKSALMLSAEIHARQGNVSLAREEAAQSFDLPKEPNWPDHILKEGRKNGVGETFRWQQAEIIASQGDPATFKILEDLVAEYPKSVSGVILLGHTYMQHNKTKEAEECFKKALKLDPKNSDALLYLGMVRHAVQDRQGAMKYFREAIAAKPNSSHAYYNLAQCLKTEGDRPGAIDAFHKAVNCQPENAAAHAALGELLLADGQLDSAEVHLQEAVALDSKQAAAKKALEDLSRRRGKSKK